MEKNGREMGKHCVWPGEEGEREREEGQERRDENRARETRLSVEKDGGTKVRLCY